MLYAIRYDLQMSDSQSEVIYETLRRYNSAAQYVLDIAVKRKLRNHVTLSNLMVPDPDGSKGAEVKLSKRVQTKFNLQSGLVDTAIRHVGAELRRAEEQDDEPSFDFNVFINYSQNTASVGTVKMMHPAVRDLHMKLSLTMATSRFQFRFNRSEPEAFDDPQFKANDLVLMVGDASDEHVFWAFFEVAE